MERQKDRKDRDRDEEMGRVVRSGERKGQSAEGRDRKRQKETRRERKCKMSFKSGCLIYVSVRPRRKGKQK